MWECLSFRLQGIVWLINFTNKEDFFSFSELKGKIDALAKSVKALIEKKGQCIYFPKSTLFLAMAIVLKLNQYIYIYIISFLLDDIKDNVAALTTKVDTLIQNNGIINYLSSPWDDSSKQLYLLRFIAYGLRKHCRGVYNPPPTIPPPPTPNHHHQQQKKKEEGGRSLEISLFYSLVSNTAIFDLLQRDDLIRSHGKFAWVCLLHPSLRKLWPTGLTSQTNIV